MRKSAVKHLRKVVLPLLLTLVSAAANAQMSKVQTVWVILMENHNWIGNWAGAPSAISNDSDPDLKGNPLAPFINGALVQTSAHAEKYFNPPGNHPSQPNYWWLEAGSNFGVLADTQPGDPQLNTEMHLVHLLENAGITWKAYAEPDFGSPTFDNCPLDFSSIDVEHLPFVYFNDINDGLNPNSPECIAHVRPYGELATDLANNTVARYNFIVPNLCHDGHEGVTPCDPSESPINTLRSDQWLRQSLPVIQQSDAYKAGGAILVIWDEGEDSGEFSDGPIGMFLLSPFAKGCGESGYSNSAHYDHSSTLKTMQEIFKVTPLLGAAAAPTTMDLSDLFLPEGSNGCPAKR
jgi:phospholipase C